MSKVAKTPPLLDKSIKMEDDYLKSRRALATDKNTILSYKGSSSLFNNNICGNFSLSFNFSVKV